MYRDPERQRAYLIQWRKKNPGYHSRYWHKVMKPLERHRKPAAKKCASIS